MIDVDKTIYISLIDKVRKLRYQAQDNPQDFKSILRLIILSDILEWSKGLDLPQSLQESLIQKQVDMILCNPAFKVQYADTSTAYVNVNTAQTNSTWKRVWDSKYGVCDYIVEDSPEGVITLYPLPKSFIKVNDFIIKEIPELDK